MLDDRELSKEISKRDVLIAQLLSQSELNYSFLSHSY